MSTLMRPSRGVMMFALVLVGAVPPVLALDASRFAELHDELAPPPDEAWRALPWELSLVEARARALEERKPVYLLVRSGHPLGCV